MLKPRFSLKISGITTNSYKFSPKFWVVSFLWDLRGLILPFGIRFISRKTENWVFLRIFCLLKIGKTGVSSGTSWFFSCLYLVYVNVRKFCRPGRGCRKRITDGKGINGNFYDCSGYRSSFIFQIALSLFNFVYVHIK